jgi:hypothetical protein
MPPRTFAHWLLQSIGTQSNSYKTSCGSPKCHRATRNTGRARSQNSDGHTCRNPILVAEEFVAVVKALVAPEVAAESFSRPAVTVRGMSQHNHRRRPYWRLRACAIPSYRMAPVSNALRKTSPFLPARPRSYIYFPFLTRRPVLSSALLRYHSTIATTK